MISLTKKQVPAYLRTSSFYGAIEDEEDSFEVPLDCFKEDAFVASESDLHRLLSTLRFWGLDQLSSPIVTFVSLHRPREVLSAFANFRRELKVLDFLEALCVAIDLSHGENTSSVYAGYQSMQFNIETSKAAAQICLLQYQNFNGCVWDVDTCRLAAQFGLLPVLRFLHEHGCPWDGNTCKAAAEKNMLAALKYAHDNGCPWDEETCRTAAICGSLQCLQYAVEHGCPWGEKSVAASLHLNRGECFDYLSKLEVRNGPLVCAAAAGRGDLGLLKRLKTECCEWDATTPAKAARGGYLDILKYAHENGCPWDASTCREAASKSLECLRYAHEHGCPWNASTTAEACTLHTYISVFPLRRRAFSIATLQYAHEHGCPWNSDCIRIAVMWNHLEAIKYAHEHGCAWELGTLQLAAQYSNVDTLEYVARNGCALTTDALHAAILGDKMANLRFLLQNRCAFVNSTCAVAAAQSLQYLVAVHEHGCPWDESTCAAAARADKLDSLQYLRTHGCPWDIGTVRAAVEGGSLSCLKYAHENGCEWDVSLVNKIPLSSKTRKCIEYVQDNPHPVLKSQQASITAPVHAVPLLKAPRSLQRRTYDRKQSTVPQRGGYMTRSRARAEADTAHLDGQRVAKRRKLH